MYLRGPDGAGVWVSPDRQVGLAQRRLAILDLSEAGAQPMFSADRSLAVVFNGEIYNYPQLRKELAGQGVRFRSFCDTEVLLHLYHKYGTDMVRFLRGMYAFAIWDAPKKTLFCARDPFGIKPLYYADDGTCFRFASQVKALIAGKGITLSQNPAGHVGFFLLGYVPAPHTLYHEIKNFQAGTCLTIEANGEKRRWSFCAIAEEIQQHSVAPLQVPLSTRVEMLADIMRDSVKGHLLADVPLGIFLSSGFDSTILTAFATQELTSPPRTLTLGFDELKNSPGDETLLAAETSHRFQTPHQTRWISMQSFQDELPRILQAMDQPTIDGINSYFVSKAAAEAGLKVALSGLGGDELFGTYPSFSMIPATVRLLSCLPCRSFFGKTFREFSAPFLGKFTSPKFAGLLEYGGDFAGAYFLRRGLFMPWELPEFLDPDFVKQGWDDLQLFEQLRTHEKDLDSPFLKTASLELAWYMRQQLLRDTDWASMAHSLEIRVPFVDIDVFRKIIHLFRKPPRPTKGDLLADFTDKVPRELFSQKKKGFVVPVHDWIEKMSKRQTKERGHRGWAKIVYETFVPDGLLKPRNNGETL
jgi:asparagine synthase (glutamine-hydrolysing)